MSTTQPTEAHLHLAEQLLLISNIYDTAQLIADSEARAVESITKERDELKAIVDFEVKIGACTLTSDDWANMQQSLTAERERVRVLREALKRCHAQLIDKRDYENTPLDSVGRFLLYVIEAALAATEAKP
jgi:hypothetical protein